MQPSVAKRLERIRSEKGLDQKDLAELSGISTATISRLEKGLQGLSNRIIRDLVERIGVNETYLRQGIGDPFVSNVTPNATELHDKLPEADYQLRAIRAEEALERANEKIAALCSGMRSLLALVGEQPVKFDTNVEFETHSAKPSKPN